MNTANTVNFELERVKDVVKHDQTELENLVALMEEDLPHLFVVLQENPEELHHYMGALLDKYATDRANEIDQKNQLTDWVQVDEKIDSIKSRTALDQAIR